MAKPPRAWPRMPRCGPNAVLSCASSWACSKRCCSTPRASTTPPTAACAARCNWRARGAYVRSFLDEGEVIVEMLRQEYQNMLGQPDDKQAAERNYIELLLAASGTDLSRPAARAGLSAEQSLEPLSEREREILGFLCDGISNKEIASRLLRLVKYGLRVVVR